MTLTYKPFTGSSKNHHAKYLSERLLHSKITEWTQTDTQSRPIALPGPQSTESTEDGSRVRERDTIVATAHDGPTIRVYLWQRPSEGDAMTRLSTHGP